MLECPEWYTKDGPLKFKNFIDKDIRIVLPDCDKEGRPIYLLKNGKWYCLFLQGVSGMACNYL